MQWSYCFERQVNLIFHWKIYTIYAPSLTWKLNLDKYNIYQETQLFINNFWIFFGSFFWSEQFFGAVEKLKKDTYLVKHTYSKCGQLSWYTFIIFQNTILTGATDSKTASARAGSGAAFVCAFRTKNEKNRDLRNWI